jgi:hypothetical protein
MSREFIMSSLNKSHIKKINYFFGLLAFLIGILGYIISLVLTPTYRMWAIPLSNLLVEDTGIYARIGLIISNFMAIPFVVTLGIFQKSDNVNESIRRIAIGAGIFSCTASILSGFFAGHDVILSNLHGLFVLLSWIGGSMTVLGFSFLMLKNPKFSKFITANSFLVATIFVLFLIPFFITNFCSYFPDLCYNFGQLVYPILPTWEWAVVISILYWYMSNSIYVYLNYNYTT